MSALLHLSDDDRAWALAMLDEWACDELGRHLSGDYTQRQICHSDARRWLTGFDPEQAAANAGFRVIQCGSPYSDTPPALSGAKRTDP